MQHFYFAVWLHKVQGIFVTRKTQRADERDDKATDAVLTHVANALTASLSDARPERGEFFIEVWGNAERPDWKSWVLSSIRSQFEPLGDNCSRNDVAFAFANRTELKVGRSLLDVRAGFSNEGAISRRMSYLKGVNRHPEILAKVKSAVDHCDLRDVDIAGLDNFREEFQAVCHLVESCGELAQARLAVLSPALDRLKENGKLSESEAANAISELDWLTHRLKKLQESWSPTQLDVLEIARKPAQEFFGQFDALFDKNDRDILLEVFREFLKQNKGKEFGSLAANKDAASAINNAMNQLGVRAKFLFRGKQVAAGYRCARFENSPNGQFYFEFSIDGKQEQQGHRAVLHDLELVAPSPRKRSAAKGTKSSKRAAPRNSPS